MGRYEEEHQPDEQRNNQVYNMGRYHDRRRQRGRTNRLVQDSEDFERNFDWESDYEASAFRNESWIKSVSGLNSTIDPFGMSTVERIAAEVKQRLDWDERLDKQRIHVDVHDRDVVLRGNVRSESARRAAEEVARSVARVRNVVNQLITPSRAIEEDRWRSHGGEDIRQLRVPRWSGRRGPTGAARRAKRRQRSPQPGGERYLGYGSRFGRGYDRRTGWEGEPYDPEEMFNLGTVVEEDYHEERDYGYLEPGYGAEPARLRPGRRQSGGLYSAVPLQNITISDGYILQDVVNLLTWHGRVNADEVEVDVENGDVWLYGTVDSRNMKRLAEDIAESVKGVIDVHNRLKVRKSEDKVQARQDPTE